MSIIEPASALKPVLPHAMRVHPADHVAVALRDLAAGSIITLDGVDIVTNETIGKGHKVAVAGIAAGADIRRYGGPIGHATADISIGQHVHSHNLATNLVGEEPYAPSIASDTLAATASRRFRGYVRAEGAVGTRNQIWVLPTVGCVAKTAQRVAGQAAERHRGTIDDVVAFPHPFGCSQLGADLDATARVLASLACNPNAGGVLLLGLGCEENQLNALLDRIPAARRDRVRTVGAQMSLDEMTAAERAIDELVAVAGADVREDVGLGALRLGLKCGGSDGLSGLTANPLIGRAADAVPRAGGTAILTKSPRCSAPNGC